MRNLMDQLFRRYGTDAVILRGDDRQEVKAFFHSVNSRSWQNMEHGYSPLGRIPRGQYLCILPAGGPAQVGDSLILRGIEYEIRKLENKYMGAQVIYVWGLCVEKGA